MITVMKDATYDVAVLRYGKMQTKVLRKKEFPETFRMRGDVIFIDVNGQQRPALITRVHA